MRQGRWPELLKDYDMQIHYHPGKGNSVADALSRKLVGSLACLAMVSVEPTIIEEVKTRQMEDEFLKRVIDEFVTKPRSGYTVENKVLKFEGRLCVADVPKLKRRILQEAHGSRFAIHPGNTKMYQDVKQTFWWPNMKRERRVRISVFILPTSESRALEVSRTSSTFVNSRVEMGTHHHGFCNRVAEDAKGYGFNLGYS